MAADAGGVCVARVLCVADKSVRSVPRELSLPGEKGGSPVEKESPSGGGGCGFGVMGRVRVRALGTLDNVHFFWLDYGYRYVSGSGRPSRRVAGWNVRILGYFMLMGMFRAEVYARPSFF